MAVDDGANGQMTAMGRLIRTMSPQTSSITYKTEYTYALYHDLLSPALTQAEPPFARFKKTTTDIHDLTIESA